MPDIVEVEINGGMIPHPDDKRPLVAHVRRRNIRRIHNETFDAFRARVLAAAEASWTEVIVWNASRPGDEP